MLKEKNLDDLDFYISTGKTPPFSYRGYLGLIQHQRALEYLKKLIEELHDQFRFININEKFTPSLKSSQEKEDLKPLVYKSIQNLLFQKTYPTAFPTSKLSEETKQKLGNSLELFKPNPQNWRTPFVYYTRGWDTIVKGIPIGGYDIRNLTEHKKYTNAYTDTLDDLYESTQIAIKGGKRTRNERVQLLRLEISKELDIPKSLASYWPKADLLPEHLGGNLKDLD